MISEVYNCDCSEYMATIPDNYFDLCIADPPYGINISNNPVRQAHTKKEWDCMIPNQNVFDEMFRVSRYCIIWGGNYFNLPPNKNFIIWDKEQPLNFSLAMCEYAWTNFDFPSKLFRYRVTKEKGKIHPTQKPVALYSWILDNYADKISKDKIKVFDPFLGSGSSIIACYKKGFDFYACELDEDYYTAQEKRFRLECFGEHIQSDGKIVKQMLLNF